MNQPDQPTERFVPHLDDMLTPGQAAEWLQISERELGEKTRAGRVPVFDSMGQKTRRYHPRTIIAKMARDAGIPMELIAASFGIHADRLTGSTQHHP